jgi:hypothetical protein
VARIDHRLDRINGRMRGKQAQGAPQDRFTAE